EDFRQPAPSPPPLAGPFRPPALPPSNADRSTLTAQRSDPSRITHHVSRSTPMSRPCAICAHSDRADIETVIATRLVAAAAIARLARVSLDSVRGHRVKHMPPPPEPAPAAPPPPLENDGDLLAQVRSLHTETM